VLFRSGRGKSGEVTKSVMITCNTAKIVETINIKASIKTKTK
jgi:hypothetical protein